MNVAKIADEDIGHRVQLRHALLEVLVIDVERSHVQRQLLIEPLRARAELVLFRLLGLERALVEAVAGRGNGVEPAVPLVASGVGEIGHQIVGPVVLNCGLADHDAVRSPVAGVARQIRPIKYIVAATVELREAIAALKSEHLVITRQGVGAFVVDQFKPRPFEIETAELASVEEAVHILELRMAVEIEMASAAAQRRLPEHLKEMWRQYEQIDNAQTADQESTDSDFALHRAIAQGSRNPYFLRFIDFLGARIIPPRSIVVEKRSPEDRRKYIARIQREHRRIIEAIAAKDAEEAMAAMRAHVGESRARHRERLKALRKRS